jgi:hypothetical protein
MTAKQRAISGLVLAIRIVDWSCFIARENLIDALMPGNERFYEWSIWKKGSSTKERRESTQRGEAAAVGPGLRREAQRHAVFDGQTDRGKAGRRCALPPWSESWPAE